MTMIQKVVCFLLVTTLRLSYTEKITYLSFDRPETTFYNAKYMPFMNLTLTRYHDKYPVDYVGLHFDTKIVFGNNVTVDFYFFEFRKNKYQRSFVDMHYRWCDLIHKDFLFGPALRQGKLAGPCPYQPGDYHLHNMTLPVELLSKEIAFKKGRIYANITLDTTKERLVCAQIDMELKEWTI